MAASWTFELKDEMSGPGRNIVVTLNQVQQATRRVKDEAKEAAKREKEAMREGERRARQESKRVKDEQRQADRRVRTDAREEAKRARDESKRAREEAKRARDEEKKARQAREELKDRGVAFATAIGVGMERVVEKLFDVGRQFVETVATVNRTSTQTKIAFEVMSGSSGQAIASFEELKRVAFALGRPVADVAASYKEMLSAGEDPANLQFIAKAASDLAHLEGGSMETWTSAFSNILGRGEMTGRGSLEAFIGAVDFDVLAKKLGFATHGFKALRDQLNETPVEARRGIQAILQAVAEGEGGKLETISRRMRDTFSGTVDAIKEQFTQLFDVDADDSMILQFLHGVRDALDPEGPLVVKIRDGAQAFMEGLGLITSGKDGGMASLLKSLKDGTILGDDFRAKMKEVGEDVRAVAEATGLLAKGIVKVSKALIELRGGGYREMEGKGIVRPATREESSKAVPISSMSPQERYGGDMTKAAWSYLFGPSEVEKALLGVPRFAQGGRVTGPTLAMVGEGGEPENIIPDSKMPRGASLHLEQHFHIEGGSSMDVQSLAQALHSLGLSDFQGALDTLGQSMGGI